MDQWSITALGMGTVFLSLILLSLILSLFPFIFRKPEKKRAEPAPLPELHSTAPAVRQAAPGPSAELIAVIAAAVAAASGQAPGAFRIASVTPASSSGGFNTPVWGHADRASRPDTHR